MLTIIDREIKEDERKNILIDIELILLKAGVPDNGFKRYSLAADEDRRTVGFISGLRDHKWLFLTDIWVKETHRRQGIGSQLLKSIEDKIKADGLEHIYLWTYGPDNQKFYEKNGYYQFAVFEDFYEVKGYHQIGYRKELY